MDPRVRCMSRQNFWRRRPFAISPRWPQRPFLASRRGFVRYGALQSTAELEPRKYTSSVEPSASTRTGQAFDRSSFDGLLRRRLYYTPAYEAYGGVSGLYDYGPPGCALQANIIELWRKHFVLEEGMLEVDTPLLTPHAVLKASGHVDRFADLMCKDVSTGEIFRVDHVVKEALEHRLQSRGHKKLDEQASQDCRRTLAQLETYDGSQMQQVIERYQIKSPTTGADLSSPVPFNLMFETRIGPTAAMASFLRPETAQGQFLNFERLYEANQRCMPFASASVGKCFRNEISPRSGLLRVREFVLAEIEHYVDPAGGKRHERFGEVREVEMRLLSRAVQEQGRQETTCQSVGDAVSSGTVNNETLGYFLGRIQLFLEKLGLDRSKIRFRQHLSTEMAHYASDCWDAEILTSFGWIECVGCADRSAFDLNAHSAQTGKALTAREPLKEARQVEEWQVEIRWKEFGQHFKRRAKAVAASLDALSQTQRQALAQALQQHETVPIDVEDSEKSRVDLPRSLVVVEKRSRLEHVREYTPNVIEPSFGIGRLLYSLLEHVYWTRSGSEKRAVLSLPPVVAPIKVLVAPLSNNESLQGPMRRIAHQLRSMGISHRTDESSTSIGRRYSRHDEVGTALGITIDFQTTADDTITLRDRDTTQQVRGGEAEVLSAVKNLVDGAESWEDVTQRLPKFVGQDAE